MAKGKKVKEEQIDFDPFDNQGQLKVPTSKPTTKPTPAAQESKSWYKKGSEGVKEKEKQDLIAKMKKDKNVPRFWLKPGETARVVFVDSEGFYINEHNLEIDGKFGNYFTCTKDFTGECPIDSSGRKDRRPQWTGYYTVIDTREFEKKDGTKVKNSKILYPAKGTAIRILDDLRRKYGTLAGLAIDIKRYQDKDPNCGIAFDVAGKVKNIVAKFGEGADQPLNYEKILAIPTDDEYASVGIEHAAVIGSQNDLAAIDDEDTDDLL